MHIHGDCNWDWRLDMGSWDSGMWQGHNWEEMVKCMCTRSIVPWAGKRAAGRGAGRAGPAAVHGTCEWIQGEERSGREVGRESGAGDRGRDENGDGAAGHRRRRRRRAGGGCNLDGERDVDEGALVDRALFQVLKIVVNAVNEWWRGDSRVR